VVWTLKRGRPRGCIAATAARPLVVIIGLSDCAAWRFYGARYELRIALAGEPAVTKMRLLHARRCAAESAQPWYLSCSIARGKPVADRRSGAIVILSHPC
jgi:hypothetical protein